MGVDAEPKSIALSDTRRGGVSFYLVGVPVRVEDDHGVGGLQVEAQAAGTRAEQEDEVLGVGVVEGLQQHAAVVCLSGA